MPPPHTAFEWDENKAATNLRKHRVAFDDAASALSDPDGYLYHVDAFDESHGESEERFNTFASLPQDRGIVLLITWTGRGKITRIISARAATKAEKRQYGQELRNRP